MSAADILGNITRATLVVVTLVTLVDLLRHRDRARVDIHLMFAALTTIIVIVQVALATGLRSRALGVLVVALFIAQPYLLLRLVLHFRPVHRLIRWGALAGLILSCAGLILIKDWNLAGKLVLMAYFIAVEGYATFAFLSRAWTARGAMRWRCGLAGVGSMLFVAAFLFAFLNVFLKVPREKFQIFTQANSLGIAVCYLIGFAPPRKVRKSWQTTELHRFLVKTAGQSTVERATASLEQLCVAARDAVGSVASVAACWDESGRVFRVIASSDKQLLGQAIPIEHEKFRQAWDDRKPVFIRGPLPSGTEMQRLAGQLRVQAILVVPIATVDWTWGVLLVFLQTGSLFAEDDLGLLSLMAVTSAHAVKTGELLVRHRTIVESAPYAMVVLDPGGRIVQVNAKAVEYFGYSQNGMAGLSAEALLPNLPCLQPLPQGTLDLEARRQDGTGFPAGVRFCALTVEAQDVLMMTIEDTTAATQAADEIATRTAQLEAANKELEAFSYSVSHDLRAPLRAIDGFSRILEEDHGAELSAEAKRYLKLVRDNTIRMGALIDDLLAFARLGRQPMRKLPIDAAELTRRVFAEVDGFQKGKPVELVIGDLPACEADPALLKQVFINLISNAVKFSRDADKPRVEIGCHRNGGPETYFVKDNGVGFDMAYVHKLFGVFQRLHGPEQFEGTGVGLAIVQRIIQRHGGRVWADSKPGQGATFYFTLEGVPTE